MGLDIYLYHCPNRTYAREQEDLFEKETKGMWRKICGSHEEWDALAKEEQDRRYTVYKGEKQIVAEKYHISEHDYHESVTKIEENSKLYPDHLFKIGYFRSSYNGSGIERILNHLALPTLEDIFCYKNDHEFTPCWNDVLIRVNHLIQDYSACPHKDLRVMAVQSNIFINESDPVTEPEQAMKIAIGEFESHKPDSDFRAWENRLGEFHPEGLNVVALIPGKRWRQACTYVVFRCKNNDGEGDWYLHALEIVRETIQFVLAQTDPNNYYVHWSG